MNRFLSVGGLLVLMLALVLAIGCGSDDSPTDPVGDDDPPEVTNLPVIPEPSSVNELLPAVSDDLVVGLSDEVPDFMPQVTELRMMMDDGEAPWIDFDRRLTLACDGVLPEYTGDPGIWRTVVHLGLAAPACTSATGARSSRSRSIRAIDLLPVQETITSGTSTTNEQSRAFSQTMGIEVTAGGGWGPFSASVTASYEQTETVGEINSVTFTEETSESETFTVQADPDTDHRLRHLAAGGPLPSWWTPTRWTSTSRRR